MALACETCGGIGYGVIDPDTGWRSGSPRGQAPKICPDCERRFKQMQESKKPIQLFDMGKVVGEIDPKTLTYGKYIAPGTGKRGPSISVVGGGNPENLPMDEFDPGVVNTGSEKVSIDEALAKVGAAETGG